MTGFRWQITEREREKKRTLLLDQRVVPVVGVVGISAASVGMEFKLDELVSISSLMAGASYSMRHRWRVELVSNGVKIWLPEGSACRVGGFVHA